MSRIGESTETVHCWLLGAGGWGVTAHCFRGFLWEEENVLELDSGGGHDCDYTKNH